MLADLFFAFLTTSLLLQKRNELVSKCYDILTEMNRWVPLKHVKYRFSRIQVALIEMM